MTRQDLRNEYPMFACAASAAPKLAMVKRARAVDLSFLPLLVLALVLGWLIHACL